MTIILALAGLAIAAIKVYQHYRGKDPIKTSETMGTISEHVNTVLTFGDAFVAILTVLTTGARPRSGGQGAPTSPLRRFGQVSADVVGDA